MEFTGLFVIDVEKILIKMTKPKFRIPKGMTCSIMGCGRKATRYLIKIRAPHRYLCDACHRAYVLGRSNGYRTRKRE